jgi:hypothetical protein
LAALDRLPRYHYIRWDTNDYSVHPTVIVRRIEVPADLHQVQVFCEVRLVAGHERSWAKHQTISDAEHVVAGRALRHERFKILLPATEPVVEQRRFCDFDTAVVGAH